MLKVGFHGGHLSIHAAQEGNGMRNAGRKPGYKTESRSYQQLAIEVLLHR